mmetsp:Transcript_6914/g.11153  ORF Transcript_6914/g.11153 Transcript_6914/m.11153 type:complete len:217 (+) Transcript_6914:89-739(+)|eukprot:CAMPEP_0169131254 /NCGR_PEP_ID=MMETSP1015-20121227/38151_1 /TAXON_ID=342587 /ORGANISM="Karlodinium micrum, Strain CCMP2283" /LENGTH=216 /DNA_ID=CAMNT_0009195507 /DNA_START=84 /DNA_END=734 /DNA_ORIENTATION=+
MPGAIGAVVASRRRKKSESEGHRRHVHGEASGKRKSEARSEDAKQKALKSIMAKYDTNKSGKLELEQIKKLLTDTDEDTPSGTPPTEDEVNFILQIADHAGDGCLAMEELGFAIKAWHVYCKNRADMDKEFQKFSKPGQDTLNHDELKEYLKSLNGGCEVSDDEVKWVMHEADVLKDGVIHKEELLMATSAWYSHVEDNPRRVKTVQASSVCCSVM